MTIRDKTKWADSAWDWNFLRPAFGRTGISVGDVDGIVERNGKTLILETKGVGVPVPAGQMRMFRAQTVVGGSITVFVIWGNRNDPKSVLILHNGTRKEIKAVDEAGLVSLVSQWFAFADKAKESPDREDTYRKAVADLKDTYTSRLAALKECQPKKKRRDATNDNQRDLFGVDT